MASRIGAGGPMHRVFAFFGFCSRQGSNTLPRTKYEVVRLILMTSG